MPPAAATVAVPFMPPAQDTLLAPATVMLRLAGFPMTAVVSAVQPLPSVTVTT